jgi:hypothetical protein
MINFAINRIKAQTIIRKSPENFKFSGLDFNSERGYFI